MREGEKPIYEISLLPWNITFGAVFTKTTKSFKKLIQKKLPYTAVLSTQKVEIKREF